MSLESAKADHLRRSYRGRRLSALGLMGALLLSSNSLWAASTDQARERATETVAEVEQAAAKLTAKPHAKKPHQPEALVAEADLHLRTHQYDVAIDKLSKVVELRRQGKASESTDADAQYMLGEAYFATGQLYSARTHFELVTDKAEDPSYSALGGPAASRLVDIALQIQRTDTLADVLGRVDRMLARSSNESLLYARAKVLFAMGRYEESRQQASSITGNSLYSQRASYLRGTALMKEAQAAHAAKYPKVVPSADSAVAIDGASAEDTSASTSLGLTTTPVAQPGSNEPADFRAAIAAFEQAAVPPTGLGEGQKDARRIADLAWLAVARLQYEAANYKRSAVAYQKIPRTSEYFSQGLFELAWTYVRLGDYERAQRALEALAVLEPGLIDGADAELLRADLMLRSGRFKEAEAAYEQVRAKYEPLRGQVHEYLTAHDDPAIYYDKLTAAEIETGTELPALAVDWAREEAEEERVFAIVDDVARSRSLIKRSRRIVTLLRASLGSSSRAKVFPEVQAQLEDVVSLVNQLAVARLSLARGMDEVASGGSAELNGVRSARRKLMARLGKVPTNAGDFSIREAQSERVWNQVSQNLQRLQLEADHLKALVNGLRRMLSEAERHGVNADAASLERFRLEIAENEKDLSVYFVRIEELRQQVEVGRVQSGFGDEWFEEDDRVRDEFNKLFAQEVAMAAGGADRKAAPYSKSIQGLLGRIESIDGRLRAARAQLDADASARGEEMQIIVNQEAQSIEAFASRLDTMDQHARLLVGEVARSNFVKARDRIKDVVMRADVGLVQQAWEVREEQRHRVRDLLRERAREERFINDELREVLDDAEEGQ